MAAIVVDDEALVGFHREDGRLLFRMLLKDELNQPVLVVDRSELRIRADAWDVEFVGQTLTVRNGPGDIFLEMRIEPPSTVTIERARILSNGAVFMIGNEGITIGSSLINIVNGIYLRSVGIVVGFSPNFGRGYAVNRYEWIASR
jgi:trigger factor